MNKKRTYKIGELYKYNKFVPVIKITGKWLEKHNFKTGDKINLLVEKDKLIITKENN